MLGPGLPDWNAAREILLGRARYTDTPDPEPVPALLPANERRRASTPARWALMVGSEALAGSGLGLEEVAIVFASCGGDGMITDQICRALAASPPEMSPTRFHNSVHNAPAGYWSIFARSRAPSTTLCGFDASFAAGLLEAAAQTTVEQRPVLLVAYDLPCPDPLRSLWPVSRPFAAALLLAPVPAGNMMRLAIELEDGPANPANSAWPEMLPRDLSTNPAAQALMLLTAAAKSAGGRTELQYLQKSHVAVEISP
ncbi:MAG: beta-ketoacyl synthase chain length factor [Pseudomonadota bacterium]